MTLKEDSKYKKIMSDIEEKLAGCGLTADDLFLRHLHFGEKFTDPLGIYVVYKKDKYMIYYLNIHGIENVIKTDTEAELCLRLLMDGITDYAYRTYKCNAQKKAAELMKAVGCNTGVSR